MSEPTQIPSSFDAATPEGKRDMIVELIQSAGITSWPEIDKTGQVELWFDGLLELINRYAPQAPGTIKREAMRRLMGYSFDTQTITQESIGDLTYSFQRSSNIFYSSGAQALLSRFKARRARKI